MQDFVKTVGLEDLIRHHGYDPADNFETVYSSIHKTGMTSLLDELNHLVRTYFEEVRLPKVPTIHDYLVLSLRPKDVIISFNWNPLLPQAFQRWRALAKALPELVFLHGNVDVGLHRRERRYGFLSDHPTFEPTRLLDPVEQKDYNCDNFIAEQWNRATWFLGNAYLVTVFGYSSPVTDVEARSLLLDAWIDNPTYTLAEIKIIDITNTVDVEISWSDFIYGLAWWSSERRPTLIIVPTSAKDL
jgi:hypothetical protein